MSKIFDALRKAQGEASSFALPLIDAAGNGDSISSIPSIAQWKQSLGSPVNTTNVLKSEPGPLQLEEVQIGPLSRLIVHTDSSSIAADRFRLLRMRLGECWKSGQFKSVLITSPLPGDGKSTTALNLVTALAEEKSRSVLLIDADLHRRSLTEQLNLQHHNGFADCLQFRHNPLPVIRRVQPLGWYFLPCGQYHAGSPTDLLQPRELGALIRDLTSQFDWVIIDSPPLLPLSDAVALRQHVDGTLLIAKAGFTPESAINKAIELLGKRHIVGLVLNGVEKVTQPYSSYYQYSSSHRKA